MSGSPSNDRLQSLQASISQYLAQTNFDVGDQGEIDRIERRLASNPEKFITPNPGVPFQEDLSGNWERIKSEFGLTPQGDLERQLQDYDRRVRDFLLQSVRQVIDEQGVLDVANYVYDGTPTGDPSVDETIDDMLAEASPDVFKAEIENRLAELEDEVPGTLEFGQPSADETAVLETINDILGENYSNIDRALDDIQSQLRNAETDAERRIINRFEAAFGQRYDGVDDAINSLRDQFDTLQDLDIDTVEASFLGGRDTPNVSLPAGFGEYEDAVLEAIGAVIDLEATADQLRLNRSTPFGDVRIRQGEIEQIDYGKAIENPKIVIREDAEITPDRAIDIEGTEAVTSVDPEEIAADDDDDGETPDLPESFEGFDEDATEAAQQALEQADEGPAPAVVNLAGALTQGELFDVAAAISQGRLPEAIVDELADVIESASADERKRAREGNQGFSELQSRLGLDPGAFQQEPDVEVIEQDEPDTTDTQAGELDQDDVTRRRGESPNRGLSREDIRDEIRDVAAGAAQGENIRTQPNSDRPDPNQQQADRKLEPFFAGSTMKAQQWVAAEQRRLKPAQRGQQPLDPATFWDEFGSNVWASLSKAEFVNLTADGFAN